MDEDSLEELNPGKDFTTAGVVIMVASVRQDSERHQPKVKRIEIDKSQKQVRAYGDDSALLAVYPATIGSEERPAQSGTLKVKGVAKSPNFTYKPKYQFEGVNSDKSFTIAPGPNNPVGTVWIEFSKEGYGAHGTPEPAQTGKATSHGCVRLTNWDALALAERIESGVEAVFLANAN